MKVLGPNTCLPGQAFRWIPDGTLCDHCGEKAMHLVATEVDTCGVEAAHVCSNHFVWLTQSIAEARAKLQLCDFCGVQSTTCKPFRDPEEGASGPIYDACEPCRTRINAAFCEGDTPEEDEYSPEFDDPEVPNDDETP